MYLAHFGLDEPPFRITPHTEFFFEGANRGATLEALLYTIANDEGIVKVTGEVGSGKTMLCRVLIERLPKTIDVIYLANPSLSRDEILHVLAEDLHVEAPRAQTTILLRALQDRLITQYASGRRVVVLIDEAHAMPLETLEEIRLLSNLESSRHKLLQIVLFGQPELDEHLALPNMRQLKERITHSFKLAPLIRADIDQYVDFRLRAAGYRGPALFPPQTLRLIAKASEGLTRRINILADKTLLAAFADGTHQVSAKHARAAIRDSDYKPLQRGWQRWGLAIVGLAAGLGIGIVTARFSEPGVTQSSKPDSNPSPAAHASPATVQSAPPSAEASLPPPEAPPQAIVAAPTSSNGNGSSTRPPALGKLAQQRFAATQEWLKNAAANQYVIQLLTISAGDPQPLEQFLKLAGELVGSDQLHVYGANINGQPHYSVAYGTYPSADAAIAAMGELPVSLKARGPYQRSIRVIRQQSQE